jgi:benzoyl-CoA reductase subunit C
MPKDEILAELRQVIREPDNTYIQDWKKSGGLTMGYFCTYMPLELFTAAGILPVRIRGAGCEDSSPADAYLSNRICPFVRHATSLALDERYDFLDGAVFLNTCDHVRRANDVWKAKTSIPFFDMVSVPRTPREALLPWYMEEVNNLRSHMEDHFKVKVTDEALREAIETHNKVRQRLIRLNDLRGMDKPRLTGEEMLIVSVASQLIPAGRFIELADELIADIEATEPEDRNIRARIVVIGGELDEPEFLRIIEGQGAAVVADNVCFSTRYFSQLIQNAGDPLETICRGYLFNIPCSRMIGMFPQRYEQLEKLMRKYNAEGVIFQRMKFCDPWGGDAHNMMHRKKTTGMHLLVLDREYGVSSVGQVKTRVQAFLESLGK